MAKRQKDPSVNVPPSNPSLRGTNSEFPDGIYLPMVRSVIGVIDA
jgi:hypothetical protein